MLSTTDTHVSNFQARLAIMGTSSSSAASQLKSALHANRSGFFLKVSLFTVALPSRAITAQSWKGSCEVSDIRQRYSVDLVSAMHA